MKSRNYPATLFSESGSDMFFCFHSYPDCAKDPNMVVARHIKDPLAIHSKAEMTNAVMGCDLHMVHFSHMAHFVPYRNFCQG